MKKYCKPCVRSYCAERLCEIISPIQTASIELQINFQQIQANLHTKTEKVIALAKKEMPKIFNLDNIA